MADENIQIIHKGFYAASPSVIESWVSDNVDCEIEHTDHIHILKSDDGFTSNEMDWIGENFVNIAVDEDGNIVVGMDVDGK